MMRISTVALPVFELAIVMFRVPDLCTKSNAPVPSMETETGSCFVVDPPGRSEPRSGVPEIVMCRAIVAVLADSVRCAAVSTTVRGDPGGGPEAPAPGAELPHAATPTADRGRARNGARRHRRSLRTLLERKPDACMDPPADLGDRMPGKFQRSEGPEL